VLNLLERIKAEYHLSMVFISHDLAVVNNISDRVAVMYLGRICEIAPSTDLYATPRHHYTSLLLSSVPRPGAPRVPVPRTGDIGPSTRAGAGCPFAPRCPAATALCRDETPPLVETGPDRAVACHHPIGS
jgi:peptide/nickel transport system ATP-binding protein